MATRPNRLCGLRTVRSIASHHGGEHVISICGVASPVLRKSDLYLCAFPAIACILPVIP